MRFVCFALVLTAVGHCAVGCTVAGVRRSPEPAAWSAQTSGTTVSLRGVSAVDSNVCWASGADGTVIRTVDAGVSWHSAGVVGAETLDFRDVHAFSRDSAVVLSAGLPAKVYRTDDGGSTWHETYSNQRDGVFFDAFDFWDERRGFAFSDPVGGRLLIIVTSDGGRSWSAVPPAVIPAANDGEAGFAASGTCLDAFGAGYGWIGTGGSSARVVRTRDWGSTWSVHDTGILCGEPSQGIFSVAFYDDQHGVVVGGDYKEDRRRERNAARTVDGGATWTPVTVPPGGFRSVVAYVPGHAGRRLVAAGTSGCDISDDGGSTWIPMSASGYHSVSFARDGAGWSVGSGGRIARWSE